MKRKPNLIIFGIDSWRVDHMILYGYNRLTTPHMDKYASGAVVFENAFSPSFPTTPGYTTWFSGIDVFAREDILEVFTSKFVTDKGVLIATHHMDEVEMLLDRIVMLRSGRVVKDFYAEDIRQNEGKAIIDVMREVYQP